MQRLFAAWPHVVRAFAMALAAVSIAWGLATTEAVAGAAIGAVVGLIVAEVMGRSRLRLPIALGAIAAALVAFTLAGSVALGTETLARMLGPARTLHVVGIARFVVVGFAATGLLRLVATRRPAVTGLELVVIALAIAAAFAAHRDGVIARPLWLADWAWREGIDPAHVFVAIGAGAVALLGVLLVAEQRAKRSLSALLVLLVLGALAVLWLGIVRPPSEDALSDLGVPDAREGEPPNPPDGGVSPDRHGQDGGMDPLDGGSADGGGTGQGLDAGALDGGSSQDGGSSDGGTDGGGAPPPPRFDQPPSDSSNPTGGEAPLAIVILDNDYSPPAQAYYFREEVLSQFNGSRFVPTSRSDADLDVPSSFPATQEPVTTPPGSFGRTAVHARVALLAEHTRPFALESPTSFAPMRNPNAARFVRTYRFESLSQSVPYKALLGRDVGDARWSPDLRAYYLQAPSDPRYAELAHKALEQIPPERRSDPFARAIAVKLLLDHELTYSTKERHAGAADPTADMLFGNKIGYCVHFAHAAVYLWRTLGIPSRVGTGYHSDEDSRHGGSAILLRTGDAHAWPELYMDGVGWIVLDVTPAHNLDPPHKPPDDDLQRLLGEMARDDTPDPFEAPKPKPKAHDYGRELSLAFLRLVVAVAAALYLVKAWRRLSPRFASERALPRVGYRAALDMLADVGISRAFGESREQFARRVSRSVPCFAALTDLHLAAHLRDPRLPMGERPELTRARWRPMLRTFRKELGKSSRRLQRLLGFINPATFLDAR